MKKKDYDLGVYLTTFVFLIISLASGPLEYCDFLLFAGVYGVLSLFVFLCEKLWRKRK